MSGWMSVYTSSLCRSGCLFTPAPCVRADVCSYQLLVSEQMSLFILGPCVGADVSIYTSSLCRSGRLFTPAPCVGTDVSVHTRSLCRGGCLCLHQLLVSERMSVHTSSLCRSGHLFTPAPCVGTDVCSHQLLVSEQMSLFTPGPCVGDEDFDCILIITGNWPGQNNGSMYLCMVQQNDNTDLCELIRRDVEQIVDDGHVHVLPPLGLK